MENSVTIVGNLTRSVELKFAKSGTAIANFGVAVNRRVRRGDDWEDEVSFFDVVAFDKLAENVSESVDKGSRVIVTGRLQQSSWETQDGDRRSKVEIVADEVGPSLRWATAEVERNERSDNSNGRQPARQSSGGGSSAGARRRPAPVYEDDEEPFVSTDPFDERWAL